MFQIGVKMTTPQPHSADEDLKDIHRLLHQPSYVVIYPETEMENGYEVAQRVLADRKKHELQARIDELRWLFNDVDGKTWWQAETSLAMPVYERISELKKELENL